MSIVEPILQRKQRSICNFSYQTPRYLGMVQKQEACIWTAEEIDLHQDLNDWNNKLNDDEKYFIKHILAFFAAY